jgi:hypothetical protein
MLQIYLLPIYLIKTNKSLKRKGFAIRRQDSDQIGSISDTVGLDLDMFGISVFAMKLWSDAVVNTSSFLFLVGVKRFSSSPL